jgi:glycosyltransferase involved in cell wall biosynthesis
MKIPRVLIVSVYYNRSSMVDESIKSITEQLSENDFLLLVDDGSKDDTKVKLEKYIAPNVKVVSYENQGFVNSIRRAIDSLDSEYIAVHGAGDLSLSGRFEKQAVLLNSNPDVGLVGTWYNDLDIERHKSTVVGKTLSSDNVEFMSRYNPFGHSTVMFRRSVYQKVGGYRSFFIFAQDRDLWCRISRHCKFAMIEEPLVLRYKSVGGSVSADFKKSLKQRYLSDFAVYLHVNEYNDREDIRLEDASLIYRPSYELMKELFKRSVRASAERKVEILYFYKPHVLQGKGLIFYPYYLLQDFLPKFCRIISSIANK